MKVAATGRKAVMAGIAIATAAVTVVISAIATAAVTSTRTGPHRAKDAVMHGRRDTAADNATASEMASATSASLASIRTSHVLRLSNSHRSSSRQLPSLKQHRRNLQRPLATSARIAETAAIAAIAAIAADVADVVGTEVEVEIAKVRPMGAPATPSHARRARGTINTA
jgi:hypothetical protein